STLRMTRREAVPRSGDTSGAAERRFPSSRLVGDAAGRLAGAGPAGWAAAPRLRTDRGVAAGFARPGLERDVAMLLLRQRLAFGRHALERRDQLRAGVARLDDVVQVAERRGHVGVGELRVVLVDELAAYRLRVGGAFHLFAIEDVDGAVGAHHRDLGRRPGDVVVGADVFARHDLVGAAVRLARDDRQLRHRRLAEGIEELGAVHDDAAPFLLGAWQKSRHVLERHERDVERVA